MVYSKTIYPLPGINYVEDPEFVSAQILRVSRNDHELWWDGTTPTGTESKYIHDFNTGRITVSADNPFIVTVDNFANHPFLRFTFEKFKVLYKK